MNRKIIKTFTITITVLLSFFTFLVTRYQYSTISSMSIILSFFIALPIIVHSKFNKIRNKKLIYKNIIRILYLISLLIILLLSLDILISQSDIFIKLNRFREIFSNLLFMSTSWLILIFSFIDGKNEELKISFILNIIVLLVIIFVHINYYINPNLKTLINDNSVGEKAIYVTQNYLYFGFMYLLLIINQFINNN